MTALVVYLQNTLARLRERQEGQTMAEYALILGGIAVVVIAGILILGPAIRDLFQLDRQLGHELPELVVHDAHGGGLVRAPAPGRAAAFDVHGRDALRGRNETVLRGARIVPMMCRAAPTTVRTGAASCGETSGGGTAVKRIDLRRNDGVAMTEFALVLPVFVLIIVGLLSFGRVLYYWIETNHVASETARWAIVDQNPFTPQTLQEHARPEPRPASSKATSGSASRLPGRGPVSASDSCVQGSEAVLVPPDPERGDDHDPRHAPTMRIENFNGAERSDARGLHAGDYKGRACS